MAIIRFGWRCGLAALSLAAAAEAAIHTPSRPLFAEKFDITLPVVNQLAQVIYYRERSEFQQLTGANVYVDGEFHTTLLPGGYTAFCLRPGRHQLGAYFTQGAHYPGKNTHLYQADLQGGSTYFLRVNELGVTEPQSVDRIQAEASLQSIHRQAHMLNRATQIQACAYDRDREQATRQYTIDIAVLFSPGSSTLSEPGREALRDLALTIRQDLNRINQVDVLSQSRDQHGNVLADSLRQQRAEIIRNQLIYNAVPSELVAISATVQSDVKPQTCIGECAVPQQQIVVYAR
ncbi:hypothetical protein HX773_21270 [Pantoea sp. B9002]|uniref:OmpA family protein n=1 Tax=Pantoea sp. B9002 TaxID=2726979 RepID=UPI0015A2F8EB|nr:hypothetical protein [Pantoea sp. B9002]NWA63439.1 hypothetical protein [Pantoea sp. B9002]